MILEKEIEAMREQDGVLIAPVTCPLSPVTCSLVLVFAPEREFGLA